MAFQHPTEAWIAGLCERNFLRLWTFPNPRQPDGRELCDVLVAHGSELALFSVKSYARRDSAPEERWTRKTVDESVAQLKGARRQIHGMQNLVQSDGSQGPDISGSKRIHLVAVALGADGAIPVLSGEFAGDFVHVFDEVSISVALGELDTITDWLHYLRAKEAFIRSREGIFVGGGEEDILAAYLKANRSLVAEGLFVAFQPGLWADFRETVEFGNRKEADRISRVWDALIESMCQQHLAVGNRPPQDERVLRVIASESRFMRRVLGQAYIDWQSGPRRARYVASDSGVSYCFMWHVMPSSPEQRRLEMNARAVTCRNHFESHQRVVVLSHPMDPRSLEGHDIFYFEKATWTPADRQDAQRIAEVFGYFRQTQAQHTTESEYPTDSSDTARGEASGRPPT